MALHPRPGECIYTVGNSEWRFFLSYEGGQYHTVDVTRGYDFLSYYSYYWRVDDTLQAPGSQTSRLRRVPERPTIIVLAYSSAPPAITWDENGVATADIGQLEALHLRPDVSVVSWTDGPGGMGYMCSTHIGWNEPYLDVCGRDSRRNHREGYPALIFGTNLHKLADLTVSECGPAPSKGGASVYIRSIHYFYHGLKHRDDGPCYTEGVCTCFTGRCKRVRVWRQHGEYRTDRPYQVTCNEQLWAPRAYRPTKVRRDGRLVWSSPVPKRYTYWVHAYYAQPVRLRFRAIAAASSVSGLSNLITWWVSE
jgi:hypothetical protein